MRDAVIVDAVRSAVGKRNGTLAQAHPTDTLGQVLMGLLDRNGLQPSQVDQVVGGCINKLGAQGMNVTRTAWLAHGGAETTPCITIDSQCGSSQEAATLATSLIALGRNGEAAQHQELAEQLSAARHDESHATKSPSANP